MAEHHSGRPRRRQIDEPRLIAFDALRAVNADGAYANLVLPRLLSRSTLPPRDRAFATQLVYGTIRHRRACDWFIDTSAARADSDPRSRDRRSNTQSG